MCSRALAEVVVVSVASGALLPRADVYPELRVLDSNGNVIDTVTGTIVAGQP